MTYITTDSLRPGMVVARKLTGRNDRVLLRAGVALSETHIHALHSLGIRGLEIRGSGHWYSSTPLSGDLGPPPVTPPEVQQSGTTPQQPEKITTRRSDAGQSLQQEPGTARIGGREPEPLVAQQTDILTSAVLEGTGIKSDSALAQVVRLCATRVLQTRNRQQIDETAAP